MDGKPLYLGDPQVKVMGRVILGMKELGKGGHNG